MYAIRRHQATAKSWCWRVRFSRRGVMYSKSFYDKTCDGSKEAKAQAVAWRDEQLAKVEAFTLMDLHTQKRANNVTGVPGVHFHKTDRQPLGFWQAKIKVGGVKSTTKSFSVRQYGGDEAYRLAVAARAEMLARVETRPFLHHTTAKRLSRQQNGRATLS
jgi:hypothetical protein